MSRKEASTSSKERGFNDVIGLALIPVAVLLMVSLLTFNPKELTSNQVPPEPITNWVGPFGAHLANALFFIFGAGAFVLPVILFAFGVACFLEPLAYLRRRKIWATVFFVSCLGLLGIYSDHLAQLNLNKPTIGFGGFIGLQIDTYVRKGMFGLPGATLIFASLYFISLLYLTNFHLSDWIKMLFRKRAVETEEGKDQELIKKARELQKEAKRLQDQLERGEPKPEKEKKKEKPESPFAAPAPDPQPSGLGADLKPVPEPMVRDLSVPQAKAKKQSTAQNLSDDGARIVEEGEVIKAEEIAARALGPATKDQILQKEEPAKQEAGEEPLPVPAPAPAALPGRLKPVKKKPIAVASTPKIGDYQKPLHDFLQHPDTSVRPTESKEELMSNAILMKNTLAQFDIEVAVGDITKGPTITRYELHPAPGVRLEKIAALSNNIAAALKAERINILAPVPGKSSVGVEVPNAVKTKVIMRDLLESEEWQNTKARIPLALGKDVYGHPIIADLAEMPHLLIAGSTGSGKSVCINSIIASLLYRFPPDDLRFVMIDPKVVELQQYNALPHLVVPVVNDPKKVILALRWVVNEMEKRYQIFAKVGVRNIKSFNERPKNKPIPKAEPELPLTAKKEKIEAGAEGFAVELDEEIVVPRDEDIIIPDKLSYIVVIIDELADLMLVAPADVEMAIARITQMARAAGIHCIVATQRPSVDVITGVIKANIPARIAFQVAAKVDSRTILDAMGADKLLGKGDMLYLPPGSARLIRAQGALITDQEIQQIVDFIAQQGKPSYEIEIHQQLQKMPNSSEGNEGCDEDEDLIQQCIEVIRSEQKASVSLMQRRLRLGYTRAARIMDELENRGIVGPSKGAEPRDILIDLDANTGAAV